MRRKHISKVGATLVAPSAPTLTAPANDDWLAEGAGYTVSATYGGSDVIDRIDWVLDPGVDEVVVATDSAAAYSQTWTLSGVSGGAHTLVARAVRGASSTDSAAIDINVLETPDDVAGLLAWYRGDMGCSAAAWVDSKGTNDLAQGTGTNQPAYSASDANFDGEPSLTFDGTDNFMQASAGTVNTGISGADHAMTVIMAIKNTAVAGVRAWMEWDAAGAGSPRFAPYRNGATPHLFRTDDGAANVDATIGGAVLTTNPAICTISFSGTAAEMFVDGTSLQAPAACNVGACTFDLFTLGCAAPGAAESLFCDFSIAELAIFDSQLAAEEQLAIEQYMGARYGITVA